MFKRVANILRQAEAKGERFEAGELKEPAEKALLEAIQSASAKAKVLYEKGDYAGYLKTFSVLKAPVDAFFDKVMVNADDAARHAPESNHRADRFPAVEEGPLRRLIDDNHGLRRSRVGRFDASTADEWLTQRREIARCHAAD